MIAAAVLRQLISERKKKLIKINRKTKNKNISWKRVKSC